MSFDTLGLSKPLLKAIQEAGYTKPTPIQKEAIPVILSGDDILAAAQTGTGKTAGFTLPLLEKLSQNPNLHAKRKVRALVLTPTRELAAQVGESVTTYGKHLPFKSTVIFGGVGIHPQIKTLQQGVDMVIGTPGRLLDLMNQKVLNLKDVEYLILDEADRMLDMGFIHDIKKIIKVLPRKRQNLLFSATFSKEIKTLAQGLLNEPKLIEVARSNAASTAVEQIVYPVDKRRKQELLKHLIHENDWKQVLVFTRTKHGANKLSEYLNKAGIKAAAIHGNKSQSARTKALADFKKGAISVLVATDIAARGIDIEQLSHVVNFELPNISEDYVHRIGRTGRAGHTGQAVSLVCIDEHEFLNSIEKLTKNRIEKVMVPGFKPDPNIKAEAINMGGRGHRNSRNRSGQTRRHTQNSNAKARNRVHSAQR